MNLNNYEKFNKDFIENFDEKDISFGVIATLGRSGSLLLQSFFDSHEQILMIPTILPIYQSWFEEYNELGDYVNTVNSFFDSNVFKTDWFVNKLGEDCEYKFDLKINLLKEKTLTIFKLVEFNRKNFILSLHLAYAYIFDIDIDITKIKSIVLHEHYLGAFNNSQGIRNDSIPAYKNYLFSNNSNLFIKAQKDFKNVKFMITIRNPYDSYLSFINLMKFDSNIIKPDRFWDHIFYFFKVYNDFKEILAEGKLLSKNNFILIEFEKIHIETKMIMEKVSKLINIEYKESLLKSTIQGQTWWGNSPDKLVNGITKDRNINEWKDKINQKDKELLSYSLSDIPSYFNYDILLEQNKKFDEVYYFPEKEFEGFIFSLFLYSNIIPYNDIYDIKGYLWIEIYPYLRKNLFSFIKDVNSNNKINNDIRYKDIDICIQYKFSKDNILSNGYLICFQPWLYTSITSEQVEYLNTLVDQVWVPSDFTRDNYIDSGVIPNKIKVINYGIDSEKYNSPTPKLDSSFQSKSFKFLYQGDLTDKDIIYDIFSAFDETFNNSENILLILLNSEYMDPYMKKEKSVVLNNFDNNSIKNKNIKINVFLDYSKVSYLDKIYQNFDCFIYPYNKESIGIPILRALNNEIPIITTEEGIGKEILGQDNAYLIKSTFEETNIDRFNDIGLINNHEKIKIDKKHFKKLLRYVYENKDEAKNKAKKAKKILINKYNSSTTMDQVNEAIEELKLKPILRYNLNKVISDLENKAKILFEGKNYQESKELYYELTKYDQYNIFYLYRLGISYFELEDFDSSLDCFIEVLENKIPDFELLKYISDSLFNLGDLETSSIYKEKALQLSN